MKQNLPRKKLLYFRKWNFLAPRLKNFLYFRKSNFLASYFSYISWRNSPSSKNKKTSFWWNFSYFWKWNFLTQSLKSFLNFLKKAFLIFGKLKHLKYFLYFKRKLSELKKSTLKKRLIFREMELSCHKYKKLLIFQEGACKLENKKFHIFCLLRGNFSNISAKEKSLLFSLIKKQNFLN